MMLSKSVSMQQSIGKSQGSSLLNLQTKKMSHYQLQMKKHYEDLEKRMKDNFNKDKEIVDHLNEWEYCDPDNILDELPMPYRAIDEIIKEDILKAVMVEIGEVEKKQLDPSYDGLLKVIHPSGDVTMPTGITAIAEAQGNPSMHLFLGDRLGNIYIFDQNKKSVITKFDKLQRKRILNISANHTRLLESHVITISVVQRGCNKVSILRYVEGENVLNGQFTISVSKESKATSTTPTAEFVYESIISLNATYLALLHYNGNVSIYAIPQPPLQKHQDIIDSESQIFKGNEEQENILSSIKSPLPSPRQDKYQTCSYKLPEVKDIPEIKPYYTIEFKGKRREKKYKEILKDIQKENDVLRSSLLGITVEEMYAQANQQKLAAQQPSAPQQVAAAASAVQKKDVKKPAGKEDKKEEAARQQQLLEQQQKQIPDILKNKEKFFTQEKIDAAMGDITADVPIPLYRPQIAFLTDKITFSNKEKAFNRPFVSEITTGLVVSWYNSKNFQYHQLNETNIDDLPRQLQYRFTKKEIFSQSQSFKPKIISNYTLIYSITCMTISVSQKYIAFGMKDGNTILWDNQHQIEKKILQSHSSTVTAIRFFHEKFVVTGCHNGSIIIHSIDNDKFYTLQNQYNVLKNNPILNIQINKYGLIQVIDSKQNVRTFNIHLGQKIAILSPKLSYVKLTANSESEKIQDKSKYSVNWAVYPQPVLHLSSHADQLYILNEEIDNEELQALTEEQQVTFKKSYQKNGILQIFKLADNLSIIYEGIKNLLRNGVEKDKVLFQFTIMSRQDLDNSQYNIQQTTQLVTEMLNTSSSNKKNSILHRPSQINMSQYSKGNAKLSINLGVLDNQISNNYSGNISSLKGPLLPSLNKLKEGMTSPKSETSSIYSARKSILKNISQLQNGLTAQKLHPEKFIWNQQYLSSSVYDPLNNTLAQARERASKQHILEESMSKSMIQLEKALKAKEDERMMKLEIEKRRYLQESLMESLGLKGKSKKSKLGKK